MFNAFSMNAFVCLNINFVKVLLLIVTYNIEHKCAIQYVTFNKNSVTKFK